jgi:hypothetical protein
LLASFPVSGNSNRPKGTKKHPKVHQTGIKKVKSAKGTQKKSNKSNRTGDIQPSGRQGFDPLQAALEAVSNRKYCAPRTF